jgi:hypothetical protein
VYLALKFNDNLVVVGAFAGLIFGGGIGVIFGCLVSVFWWRRFSKSETRG